jgi:hypothetical protein
MTEPRRPLHLAVFLGLSAGAYAVNLAGVTALQAQSEAAVLIDRVPTSQAIATIAAGHDALEARADRAAAAYARAADAYGMVGQTMADVEAQLSELAGVVSTIEGAAQSLPSRVALPRVTRVVTAVTRPAVHATTAASGG